MLVHRMVKDIKNSKVLHKIKTKDAYTAQQLYQQFKSQHLLDDRREYDEEDLMSAYPGLSKEEAKKLFDMLQRSTDAADLSLSKDNLIDAMGSGYTPVHVQKNRQGVFIVFKSDKDGKFYIVEKRSKQLFSVATSLAMAKRIIGETEDSKSKDADPRGYKVTDQIIKGFLIYKSGKGPATFFAKNENGKQFEGTMEQIKKQIDDYWVKQDEAVMKQKVRDDGYVVTTIGKYKIIEGIGPDGGDWFASAPGDVKRFKTRREAEEYADQSQPFRDSKTKDRATSGKSHRYRIKDDKLFQLRSGLKRKTKDAVKVIGEYKGYTLKHDPSRVQYFTRHKGGIGHIYGNDVNDLKRKIDKWRRDHNAADANPDLINMYKQKFEEAIDSGDKEEMKRWFREIMEQVSFTDALGSNRDYKKRD